MKVLIPVEGIKQSIHVVVKSNWQFPTNHMQTPSKSQFIYLHSALERQVTYFKSEYVCHDIVDCILIIFFVFKTNQIFIITWLLLLTLVWSYWISESFCFIHLSTVTLMSYFRLVFNNNSTSKTMMVAFRSCLVAYLRFVWTSFFLAQQWSTLRKVLNTYSNIEYSTQSVSTELYAILYSNTGGRYTRGESVHGLRLGCVRKEGRGPNSI